MLNNIHKPIIYIFIMFLPFLVFYWQIPFLGNRTIGNDYIAFPIHEQMELQYSLKHGSFPLYAPGYAGGQSTAALTLGQVFHPISHLASLMPGYWEGQALQWNTLLRLLSLGLVHLGLFILLDRLQLDHIMAFIISFITVYNLRMLDLFRYGASLENYTGYLFLCMAMAFYYIKPTRAIGPISIIISTYLSVCGGHPQMMYLGFLGAGIAGIAIPFILNKISPVIPLNRRCLITYFRTIGVCVLAGILLASAYTIPFYFDFIATNAQRVGQDYQWSLEYSSSATGMINSFFAPLRSEVHGAFGSSAIILLIAFIPLLYALRIQVPLVVTAIWAALAVIFLCALGNGTPLYYYFWKYFPLAGTFRIPDRLTMLFPFLFLLLLAWLFSRTNKEKKIKPGPREFSFSPYLFPGLIAVLVFILYNGVVVKYLPKLKYWSPPHISGYPPGVDTMIFWVGLFSLILVVFHSIQLKRFFKGWRSVVGILLAMAVIVQVTAELRYGTWVVKRRPQAALAEMDKQKNQALAYHRNPGYGMESEPVFNQKKQSILEPALAKFYRKYKFVTDQTGAYRFIRSNNVTDTIVVELLPGEALPDASKENRENSKKEDRIQLKESAFNRVLFSVEAGAPGFFAFSFPYAHNWKALIDGTGTRVYRANGYMQTVYLETGQHKIEFRYWSRAAFVGMLVSCLIFFLIGAYFVIFVLRGKQRVIGALVGVSIPLCLFFAWATGLYRGDNLGTGYTWTSKEFPPRNNLAYAKKTSMNVEQSRFYPGLGVDGDIGKPFRTPKRKKGWWQVDLGSPKLIGEIVIYDGQFQGRKYLPLQILGSMDGKTFKILNSAAKRGQEQPWRILLGETITRFVRLRSSTKIPLSFNEVEIYPPAGIEGEDITPQDMVDHLLEKTVKSPAEKEIEVWNPKGLTVQEISPQLVALARLGTFKIDTVKDNGLGMLRVRVIEPGKDGTRRLHLGYEFNRNGLNEEIPAGKTVHFIVSAAISPHLLNQDNFIAVQDFDGGWQSSKEYFQSPDWKTYHISKKVRPGVKRLVLMIRFTPRSSSDQLLIREARMLISK